MSGLNRVIAIGKGLLAWTTNPVVRLRLLRNVLCKPSDDPDLIEVYKDVNRHPHVLTLAGEQWEDGSWGRMHSKDYSLKQSIGTTEMGVERAVNLGLNIHHPILQKASGYLASVIETGKCRDRPEVNDRWETGVRLFASSTLARIDPFHPILDDIWALWYEIAARAFASGKYDEEAEVQAHKELTGATVRDSYLTLRNKYTLVLLSSRFSDLPSQLELAILNYVWHLNVGIGYLEEKLFQPPALKPGPVDRWFDSHKLLSRFPSWRDMVDEVITWLWGKFSAEGYWDFGPRWPSSVFMPLSESWRKKGVRQFDWTTRILLLMSRYYQ